ncbi:sensor histidine kinase [Nannocystis pusilla]|uniref:sensor histidine kinase n=1 Tax=Nannocystis pusilla TaxID=889268 RepID=UPI003B838544
MRADDRARRGGRARPADREVGGADPRGRGAARADDQGPPRRGAHRGPAAVAAQRIDRRRGGARGGGGADRRKHRALAAARRRAGAAAGPRRRGASRADRREPVDQCAQVRRPRRADRGRGATARTRGDGVHHQSRPAPATRRDRLPFKRFYRSSAVAAVEGLGLGLYIAHGLVEAHGGRIWVESGDTSTSFRFTLPLAEDDAPEARKGARER